MMVKKPSRRAATVIETMEKILEILKDRNQHEFLEALLQNVDLETLAKDEDEVQEDIPKWYLELFVALTKLYDQGYLDSTKNAELAR
jgi:hypothetical protein